MILLLIACAVPETAPPDLDTALRALERAHGGDQAELDQAAADLLAAAETALQFEGALVDRSARPTDLTADDIASFNHPGRDPALMVAVTVATRSPFPIDDHWPIQRMVDHRPVEPYSPELYTRTFLEGGDCWHETCDEMQTSNEMIKENLLMRLHYTTRKDFRVWGDAGGYVAWSWTPEEIIDEAGDDGILQSFTVDLWAPRPDGLLRIGTLWSENLLSIATSEEVQIGVMMSGLDRTQAASDDFLEDNP
jgi:hypothetical protein